VDTTHSRKAFTIGHVQPENHGNDVAARVAKSTQVQQARLCHRNNRKGKFFTRNEGAIELMACARHTTGTLANRLCTNLAHLRFHWLGKKQLQSFNDIGAGRWQRHARATSINRSLVKVIVVASLQARQRSRLPGLRLRL
jgi:hypothetical protein